MRFVTYNLRYDTQPDNITVQQSLDSLSTADPLKPPTYLALTGEQPWSLRRLRVADILLKADIVLAGFQEALIRQVNDLKELFGDDWAWVGVGREDGVNKGEFSPIFYKRTEIELLSTDSFWLSNTPFEPSRYPGAGCIRVCTVARFKTTTGDRQFTIRASLLLHRARFEAVNTDAPVFVLGDFNSSSTQADSGAYKVLTGSVPPLPVGAAFTQKYPVSPSQLPSFRFIDLRAEAPRRNVSANFATFTGFSKPENVREWTRIDFVFGGSNRGWEIGRYDVQTSLSDDGVLASDHRPVFVDVKLSVV
ncbi:Endonuclease/exonuclease/phosphatase [Pholiota molesta]|nr:Endonuclease/exonuclease/phosphatase [Pholiota molesta]